MGQGILLFGAMGVGDTTLGREIAKRLHYFHLDLDEYCWHWDTEIPYTRYRTKEERTQILLELISEHPEFVMSGSMWSIRKTFESYFKLAVFITAPVNVCAERLRIRSLQRWGDRVLQKGDMYENSEMFRDYTACAQSYEQDISPKMCRLQHEQWAAELPCPVLRADGSKAISENAEWIIKEYLQL